MMTLAACLLSLSVADPVRLAGEYDGAGCDFDGKPYTVRLVIAADGEAFRVSWTGPGGRPFVGVGLRTGRQLAVSWAGRADEGRVWVGLTVYTVLPDGTLDGRWTTVNGKGRVRSEVLRPAA
jgi:hypothetical protein